MTTNQPKPAPLTAAQIARVTQRLRNARERIEFEQDAPLDLDQATVIHDICIALDISPSMVLEKSLNLISDWLDGVGEEPKLLNELGRALQ